MVLSVRYAGFEQVVIRHYHGKFSVVDSEYDLKIEYVFLMFEPYVDQLRTLECGKKEHGHEGLNPILLTFNPLQIEYQHALVDGDRTWAVEQENSERTACDHGDALRFLRTALLSLRLH